MTPATAPAIRHGLRESQFRRYEPHLNKIIEAWPTPVRFTPEPPVTSVETLRARLQDAKRSLHLHSWRTIIDIKKFKQLHARIRFTIVDNAVLGGPLDAPAVSPASALVIATDNDDVIRALFTLHHHGTVKHSTLITPNTVDEIVNGFDVQISLTKENTYDVF